MILKRLYTVPNDLFDDVMFKPGANLIFGYKDPQAPSNESLNGIGKSTFLDLLDFALLGSYRNSESNRLYLARDILKDHEIALDFEVAGKVYTIKRTLESHTQIEFIDGKEKSLMNEKEARKRLGHLAFFRPNYEGKYFDEWYRRLIILFLKIHKSKGQDKFIDPISYDDNRAMSELIQYHLFLLDINNTLSHINNNVQVDKKRKVPALREVKSIVEDTYNVSDIKDANSQLLSMREEIKKLERTIENFKLSDSYKDSEVDVNEITERIKKILMANVSDRKRIHDYESSLMLTGEFNKADANRVSKIYSELSESFGEAVKVTLDTAVDFRKRLVLSRKDFFGDELKRLIRVIEEREAELEKLDNKRAEILGFLKSREAITDLTQAFSLLSTKKNDLADLNAKLTTYNTLEKEKTEIEAEEKINDAKIIGFIQDIQATKISELYDLFMETYSIVYKKSSKPKFNITDKMTSDAKIEIQVSLPADSSKANNQGRSLIYDITLMRNMIKNSLIGPRFLVHDGVFDGMDKTHFIQLYKYLSEDPEAQKMQYIFTLNQGGELKGAFGAGDEVSVESLKNDAILVLTPTSKLLGDFDK